MTDFVAQHRLAIVALLESVPSAGIVHPEEPFARTNSAFQAAYEWTDPDDHKQLRGWHVTRTATREFSPSLGRTINVHTWKLQGFMALNYPGSGLEWDAVVEQIRAAYRADMTLGGESLPGPLDQPTGMQVMGTAPVMFCGVLCHGTQLQFQTYAIF